MTDAPADLDGDFPKAIGVAETGIRRAMVLGAGSMGGGIAAQFANAGVAVDLIDVAGTPRNAPAEAGIARQLASGGFMHPDAAKLVRAGNIDDDLHRIAKADWIIEAIIEDIDAKGELFAQIERHRRPGTLITSNTSTLRREELVQGQRPEFARDFAITHFFNPPRRMPLVEIVPGPQSAVARLQECAETILGKTVVRCNDTTGFIANRVGCYWQAVGVYEARRLGLTIEEADAVNMAFGVPKTGVFGLLDLVGIDLVPHVWESLNKSLPVGDDLRHFDLSKDTLIARMIAEGRKGRKAKQGFMRRVADGGFEATDLATGGYRPLKPVKPADLPGGGKDLAALFADESKIGRYARALFLKVIAYAAEHGPEIAADIGAIDSAMQLGYAWKDGPFKLAERIGLARIVALLKDEGREVPALLADGIAAGSFHTKAGPLATAGGKAVAPTEAPSLIASARARGAPLFGNEMAEVWDLGDGVACFEARSKMNCFEPGVFDVLEETLARGGKGFRALVLGNDHPRAFSVGADLSFVLGLLEKGGLETAEAYIRRGQTLFFAMKYAPFPVVAAAHGFALGGGCEFALHADAVVAHCELAIALPEVKVGLVPAWGGCAQLLVRAQQTDPLASSRPVFEAILAGEFSSSAADARARGFLRQTDGIVMNRAHLLAAAKAVATKLAIGYKPPEPALIRVTGLAGKRELMSGIEAKLAAGAFTETDMVMAETVAGILTGGPDGDPNRPVSETDIMALELAALLGLLQRPSTRARIDHMLATGKPLRN